MTTHHTMNAMQVAFMRIGMKTVPNRPKWPRLKPNEPRVFMREVRA